MRHLDAVVLRHLRHDFTSHTARCFQYEWIPEVYHSGNKFHIGEVLSYMQLLFVELGVHHERRPFIHIVSLDSAVKRNELATSDSICLFKCF